MDWNNIKTEFLCREQSGVTADYDHLTVNYNRRTPAELLDTGGNGIHRPFIEAWVLFVWTDVRYFHIGNIHRFPLGFCLAFSGQHSPTVGSCG